MSVEDVYDDYVDKTIRMVSDDYGEMTEVMASPGPGEFVPIEDGDGKLAFELNLIDADKPVRLEIELETDAPSPGDVADVPHYGTEDNYGLRMDRITLGDESGVLAERAETLVGCPFAIYHGAIVADPAYVPEIGCTAYGDNTWTTVTSLTRHGVIDEDDGATYMRSYIKLSELAALPATSCWRAS